MKAAPKKILGITLVLVLAGVASGLAQTKTITGTIAEIARGTELDVGMHGTFYILRLKEYPKSEFRLTREEAVRSGVIKATGPTMVLTPKMSRGLGWKVKLTCDPDFSGSFDFHTYKVLSVKKLNN
jgi:hypothetical protein